MKVAIVGAGCAGSYFGHLAASAGFDVTIFDHSHPREKPCGGAVPNRNFEHVKILKELDFPKRKVERAKVVLQNKREVVIELPEPIYIVDRESFDGALLSKAVAFGARHIREKVKDIKKEDGKWSITAVDNSGLKPSVYSPFDILVGSDGVNSIVRTKLLGKQDSEQFGFSYYAKLNRKLEDEITLLFYPGVIKGYGWIFPRPSGIACGVYFIHLFQKERARKLFDELLATFIGDFKELNVSPHPIPCIKRGHFSHVVAGNSWALLGDACMLADPYIGEGIFNALLSAEVLFEAIKNKDLWQYQRRIYETVLPEVITSSRMLNRLYSSLFLKLSITSSTRSVAAKDFVGSFLSRKLGYQALNSMGLKPAFTMLREALFKSGFARKRGMGSS